MFGVRPSTIARWAREGKITPLLTPGGHRRYRPAEVREFLGGARHEHSMARDAARLYEEGWTIRQVAARFECGYGVMRRMLQSQITLRDRGARF